jgi:hypothetical protein
VAAIAHEHVVQGDAAPVAEHLDVEQPVVGEGQTLVKAARGAQRRADHRRRRQHLVGRVEPQLEPAAAHLRSVGDLREAADHVAVLGLEHLGVMRAAGGFGVGVERGDLAGELVGQHHVVAVQPRDQLAAADGQRPVQGERLALVALAADHAHTLRVALCEGLRERRRGVGRTVVGDDQLEVGEALGEHALDCLGQKALLVVGGHDHAHAGAVEHACIMPMRSG